MATMGVLGGVVYVQDTITRLTNEKNSLQSTVEQQVWSLFYFLFSPQLINLHNKGFHWTESGWSGYHRKTNFQENFDGLELITGKEY